MKTLNRSAFEHLTTKERQAAFAFVDKVNQQFSQQLYAVILFGSRARGEAEPDSDMDLLVVVSDVDPEIQKAIHYLAADVWLEYGIFLSTLVWSEAHRRKVENLRTLFFQNILKDGINLLELHPVAD
jgi:UTP:GlnB (protein PII) uridylyltransferase